MYLTGGGAALRGKGLMKKIKKRDLKKLGCLLVGRSEREGGKQKRDELRWTYFVGCGEGKRKRIVKAKRKFTNPGKRRIKDERGESRGELGRPKDCV